MFVVEVVDFPHIPHMGACKGFGTDSRDLLVHAGGGSHFNVCFCKGRWEALKDVVIGIPILALELLIWVLLLLASYLDIMLSRCRCGRNGQKHALGRRQRARYRYIRMNYRYGASAKCLNQSALGDQLVVFKA
jgi:hypothetical protein